MIDIAVLLNDYKSRHKIKNNSALAAHVGLSPSGLHRLVTSNPKGRRRPSTATIRKIADATGIDERTLIASVLSTN